MSNPFDRNPYRIPPPWNPGYALPQNVDDEGLERHAFTTAWAPRGSFDNPKVGTAGYAVPAYVKEEGYGQGAYTTRWAPRGSYAGPPVPHWLDKQSARVVGRKRLPGGATQLQIRALAGVEYSKTGDSTFANYGVTSAAALIATVKMMPPSMRTAQLRKALDKIDPNLYARAEQYATAEAKAGAPADVALERGLALAMSKGIALELVDLGKGKKPAKKSQLGAVCYNCATLGATPQPGECTADGKMIWDAGGFWRRLVVGEVCGSAGGGVVTTRTGTSTVAVTAPSGEVVGTTAVATPTPIDQKFVQVGPFLIPIGAARWADNRPLSGERKAFVDENLAATVRAAAAAILGRGDTTATASQINAGLEAGTYPIVKFDMAGSEWGLFYAAQTGGGAVVTFKKYVTSGGIFQEIWNVVRKVVAKIVDFVEDAASFVKDKACDLFTSPYGKVAGAAAGAYVGGPAGAAAGMKGAEMAGQACSPSPEMTISPPPEPTNLMPILLIGGGLAAAVLLFRKKKA